MDMIEVRALVRNAILESNPKVAKAAMMQVYDAIIDMYDHSTIMVCGIKIPVAYYDAIKPYFEKDMKIGAIKYIREAMQRSGELLGLKEAKDIVEDYFAKHTRPPF